MKGWVLFLRRWRLLMGIVCSGVVYMGVDSRIGLSWAANLIGSLET